MTIEAILERAAGIVENAIPWMNRSLPCALDHPASASHLKIEHEVIAAGTVHETSIATVALRTGVEACNLGVADLNEFEMTGYTS